MATKKQTIPEQHQHNYGPGVYVGASREVVVAVREGIREIINARIDNETMRAALDVLRDSASVDNTTVSGCSIHMGPLAPSGDE